MKLEVCGVSKRIGSSDVLKDISLRVEGGSVVGLAGVNGSGKTMLMRAMLGLMKPTSGEAKIDGLVLGKDLPFPPSVGFLLEAPAFLDMRTGLANLELLQRIKRQPDEGYLGRLLERVGLDPNDRRRYKSYSLGMKQRLGIAAAVMDAPDLIVLDEPTNALDLSGVQMVFDVVAQEKARGAAVVLASHDVRALETLSDVIYYLAEGHLDGCKTMGDHDGSK